MARFLALVPRGLKMVVEKELKELDLKVVDSWPFGVFFESSWAGCYKANLCLRSATRVVLPVLDFPAYQPEDIYNNIKRHDFTKYIKVGQTLAVDAVVNDSKLRDQRTVALKTKDAIVDQFRDKYGERPDVDRDEPDLFVLVRVHKNKVSVNIDTSGTPLFKRGYRERTGLAPIKENLAAGLIEHTGWDEQMPIIDPMCGSGTFLIEAAMKALKVAPGQGRKRFAFQGFQNFDEETFNKVLDEVTELELSDEEAEERGIKFYGYDIDGKAIQAAKINARKAGVDQFIEFRRQSVDRLEPPEGVEKGILMMNPPYGERLGSVELVKDVYRDLSFALKKGFKGWDCWILSGHPELTESLKMKTEMKHYVMNGPIECRWLKYRIF